jgi:hypothetical protein
LRSGEIPVFDFWRRYIGNSRLRLSTAPQQSNPALMPWGNSVMCRPSCSIIKRLLKRTAIAGGAISQPGESILYTTLVGEEADPYTGNGNPCLFYVHAPTWPDWPDAVVVNRQVQVTYQ